MCAIPKGTHKSISFEKELKREKKGKLEETHKSCKLPLKCAKSMKGRSTSDLAQLKWVDFSLESGGEGEKSNSRDEHFGRGKRKQL
jgi:hypothetical protein